MGGSMSVTPPSGSPIGSSEPPPPPRTSGGGGGSGPSGPPPGEPPKPPSTPPPPPASPEKPPTPELENLRRWAKGYIKAFGWVIVPVWLGAADLPAGEAEDADIVGCCCPDGEACTRWGRHMVSGLGVAHGEEDVNKILPTSNPHVQAGHVGLGALTGSESRMFVLDVGLAGKMTRARFKVSGHVLTQRTPSRGEHWIFKLEEDEAVYGSRKEVELVTGVWVLGDGGFVVLGPRPGYSWAGGSGVLTEHGLTEPPENLRLALGREKLIKPKTDVHRDDPWRTTPGTPLVGVAPRTYSRQGDIRRVVDAHGHTMTWTPGIGWRVWTSNGWGGPEASIQQVKSFISDLPVLHRRESDDLKSRGDDSTAKTALKASNTASNQPTSRVLGDLETDTRILVPDVKDWDAEGWVCGLPVAAGIGRLVNLRNGEIERDQITRRVSKQLGAEYVNGAGGTLKHLWEKGVEGGPGKFFVKYMSDLQTMYGEDWVRLLQRAAGASLYGRNGVEGDTDTVFVLKGPSRTGKSTFVETLLSVAGEYGKALGFNVLFGDKGNPEFSDAAIHGFRVMTVAEPPLHAPLNTTRLKALSGGDTITGRLPYGRSEITFVPECSLWLSTNHALEISDDALWRRLRIFPFHHSFEEGKDEWPGLRKAVTQEPAELQLALAWMLKGSQDWFNEGWGDTTVWDDARGDERTKHDIGERWAAENLEVTGSHADGFLLTEMMTTFNTWLTMNGETDPRSKVTIRDELEALCIRKGLVYDKLTKKLIGGRLGGPGVSV